MWFQPLGVTVASQEGVHALHFVVASSKAATSWEMRQAIEDSENVAMTFAHSRTTVMGMRRFQPDASMNSATLLLTRLSSKERISPNREMFEDTGPKRLSSQGRVPAVAGRSKFSKRLGGKQGIGRSGSKTLRNSFAKYGADEARPHSGCRPRGHQQQLHKLGVKGATQVQG